MPGSAFRSDPNAPLRVMQTRLPAPWLWQGGELAPGLRLDCDPAAEVTLQLASPRARLLELSARMSRPGGWLALHLALDLPDLGALRWFGFVLRSTAGSALVSRACLRSGLDAGGFHDQVFDRHILSQTAETDHHDLLAPDHWPLLPRRAPWREFILFLPPDRDFDLALHELRVFAL